MKKISEHTLQALAEAGKLKDVRLRVVDEGMKCQLIATVAGEPSDQILTTRRGSTRTMQPGTALRHAQELGRDTVQVELKKYDD